MDQLKKLGTAGWTRLESLRYGLPSARQAPMSTAKDEMVRQRQGFPAVESSLPTGLHGSSAAPTPLLDRVLGFALGSSNPLAREADPASDAVWLLDNTAYRPGGDPAAPWEAEFVAAYFDRHTGHDLSGAVSNIADKIGVDDGHLGNSDREETRRRIEARLILFARAIRPARYVRVVVGDAAHGIRQLGPGDSSGISTQTMGQFGSRKPYEVVRTCATVRELTPNGPMETQFVEPEGWMVISDIDDSIKITMTSSPIGMLQSTFYDEPTPIAGMPELYKHIQSKLTPNWFYLSASPYNLYPFLRRFLRETFPHGTLVLRDASWQDLSGLLQSFTVGTEAYKASRMQKMHDWLPRRKVICVGDSTQSDPEAYGDLARAHPGWIRQIFIRKVTGVTGMDQAAKNAPERFETAFKGLDRKLWKVFEDPKELYQAVDALVDS